MGFITKLGVVVLILGVLYLLIPQYVPFLSTLNPLDSNPDLFGYILLLLGAAVMVIGLYMGRTGRRRPPVY